MVVRVSTADSGGERFESEWSLGPGRDVPRHVHPRITQRLTVRSGTLHAEVGGTRSVFGAGEVVEIPPGVPHRFWNPGDASVVALDHYEPAGAIEAVMAAAFEPASQGPVAGRVRAALLARAHPETIAAPPPFGRAARVLAAVAARLGARLP